MYLFDINSPGCCQCQDSDDAWQLATKDVPSSLLPEAPRQMVDSTFTHVHIMYSLIIALHFVSLCFTLYNIQMCLSILVLKVHTLFGSDTLNSYVFLNIQYIPIHTSSVQFALYIVILYILFYIYPIFRT